MFYLGDTVGGVVELVLNKKITMKGIEVRVSVVFLVLVLVHKRMVGLAMGRRSRNPGSVEDLRDCGRVGTVDVRPCQPTQ